MLKLFYSTLMLTLALLINPLHANHLKKIEREISDSVITAKITAQFTESKNLNPFKVSVTTEKGTVKLSGYVGDKEAYVEALRIAKNTKGVKVFSANNLHIKKVNTAFTDAFITAQVETAVLKAKVLDDESIPLVGINATTTDGVVTLSGNVSSVQALDSIIKRVNAIKGVKKIITHLEIKESA